MTNVINTPAINIPVPNPRPPRSDDKITVTWEKSF